MNQIGEMRRQGLSVTAIAEVTGFDRKTVRKYLSHPELEPRYKPRPGRPTLLDPLKSYIEERFAAGVKLHGASVHIVVPEMDSGPIVAQAALAVHDDDTVGTLAARVLALEHRIYPAALRMMAEERVRIVAGRCRIDGQDEPPDALIAPQI